MSFKKICALLLVLCMALPLAACAGTAPSSAAPYSAENPATVIIWNYYNGDQQIMFDKMVSEFNETEGVEKGIIVKAVSQSNVNNLADELFNSVSGKIGAQEVPALAAVYPETVYQLYQEEALADIGQYFTDEELSAYVDSFIEECRITQNGQLLSFPVSKSTETFVYNLTDWVEFEQASGISAASITTVEALVDAAGKYYEWTDSLTDTPNDGKALYGRDAVDNYIVLGAYQLGHEIFKVDENSNVTVDLDRDTFKTLWDNYYIPMIKGFFGEYAQYRSDDAKTGSILSLTGSTSSVSYIPTTVTLPDDTSHGVQMVINPPLSFENAVNNAVVQQGAGYCMMKTDTATQAAAAEFLKWFTQPRQNLEFALGSAYSPVTKEANTPEALENALAGELTDKQQNMLDALVFSAEEFGAGRGYAAKPFAHSREARLYLKNALADITKSDREAVVQAINGGASLDEAIAPYITDEYFDAWFTELSNGVNDILK